VAGVNGRDEQHTPLPVTVTC